MLGFRAWPAPSGVPDVWWPWHHGGAARKEATVRTEFSVPAMSPVPTEGNLTDVLEQATAKSPGGTAMSVLRNDNWTSVTTQEFRDQVRAVARGIVANGVQPGERVGIMSRTRYEWTVVDFAIWYAGAVSVPIYETSSAEQVQWILSDSGSVAVFLEGHKHKAIFEQVAVEVPSVTRTWVFDDDVLTHLAHEGADVPDSVLDERRATLTPDTLATIIYTSGTTGRPKGCMLSQGNLMFEVENVVAGLSDVFFQPGSSTLLFLPCAHIFGRAIQLACVRAGVRLAHSPDTTTLLADLAKFQPTFLLAVPRVFEKVFNSAQQKAIAAGKGHIFDTAAATAVEYSKQRRSGGAGLILTFKHKLFDRLVYSKIKAAMGGKVRWAVSGSAPLGERLGHFFDGIGVTILEGYGLTETSAASSVNRPDAVRIGSVGQPIPGGSIKVATDGELLLKGGQVFMGYWNNEQATKEAMEEDGWFHSGDIGVIDDDGYVRITGRKKEILVTAAGKNVAPAVLEDRIRAHWLVSQCLVVGDAKPFIAALITIDADAFPAWKQQAGKPADATIADLRGDADLQSTIQDAVDQANKAVSKAESIRKFAILAHDWTEDGGQLTPSMKLKRQIVLNENASDIEALYA